MTNVVLPQLAVPADQWGTVEFAVRTSGAVEAREFLNTLDRKVRAKFLALFGQMAKFGWIANPSRFSHEADKIYGFKFNHQNQLIRFPCFQIANRWLLTHGFRKPGAQRGRGSWPKRELEKAKEIMKEHLAREFAN
ncbi:MAG: type II toxin-antitoxin system RelE/ParE family toxin [Pirellulales bacterium]